MSKNNFKKLLTIGGFLCIAYASISLGKEVSRQHKTETLLNNAKTTVLAVTDNDDIEEETTELPVQLFSNDYDNGATVGVIEIPSVEIELPILYGASDESTLKNAVSVSERSSGERTFIFGHNMENSLTRQGELFTNLPNVTEGADVIVSTENGERLFTVTASFRVTEDEFSANDYEYMENLNSELVLITCKHESEKGRWIVLCN